jgi:peptidyl-prolyl cis-trans isomerase C
MKNCFLKSRILFLVTLLSFVFITGCKDKNTEQTKDTDTNQPETVAVVDTSSDEVAVTVNGFEIKEGEINKLIASQVEMVAKQNPQITPEFIEQYKNQLKEQVRDKLVAEHLLDEKVKELNVNVTKEDVIERITEELSSQDPPISLEEYKVLLAQNGRNFDETVQDNQKGLSYEKVMDAEGADKITATEDEAKTFYDENTKQFQRPEEVRASHILIQPDPNQTKEQAKAKIEEILVQVKAGGNFEELAKANSECPSAPNGGDLGYFSKGKMTESFEKVAFEMEVGQISDVVETEYGYHIIKVTDHRQAGAVPFEEAKESIVKYLINKKKNEFAQDYIKKLQDEADIVYPSDGKQEPQIMTLTPSVTP